MFEDYHLEWNLARTDITDQEKQAMVKAWSNKTIKTIRETTDKELKGKLCRHLTRMASLREFYNLL